MNLNWYEPLYVGAKAEKKKDTIIRRVNRNGGTMDVYLVTFAANGQDIFDIQSASYLKQPALRKQLPPVIGIACTHQEAVELAVQIIEETYQQTGGVDVRTYLMEKGTIRTAKVRKKEQKG